MIYSPCAHWIRMRCATHAAKDMGAVRREIKLLPRALRNRIQQTLQKLSELYMYVLIIYIDIFMRFIHS
jgi:hypothetical protein